MKSNDKTTISNLNKKYNINPFSPTLLWYQTSPKNLIGSRKAPPGAGIPRETLLSDVYSYGGEINVFRLHPQIMWEYMSEVFGRWWRFKRRRLRPKL